MQDFDFFYIDVFTNVNICYLLWKIVEFVNKIFNISIYLGLKVIFLIVNLIKENDMQINWTKYVT